MITQYTITDSAWTAISTAGQSGTCWVDDDFDGCTTDPDIRIYHATSEPTSIAATVGKRVMRPKFNSDVLVLDADGTTDIFYARAMKGKCGMISADMA